MHARTLIPSALLALAVLNGCQGGMSGEELQQRTAEIQYNTVVFIDYDLNRNFSDGLRGPDRVIRLTAENHGIGRTETGTSQVWVTLRNHTDYNYTVEARTHFYTESGMPVDAKAVWQRVPVPANSLATYREKSVSTNRLQYRVEVRQAK